MTVTTLYTISISLHPTIAMSLISSRSMPLIFSSSGVVTVVVRILVLVVFQMDVVLVALAAVGHGVVEVL